MKQCSKCGRLLSLSEYSTKRTGQGDLNAQCKDCVAKRCRKYYESHRKKIVKQSRKYQQTHKEKIAKQKRKYSQLHKTEIAEYRHKYRQTNKAECAERDRKYHQEHKAEAAEYNRKHKAEKTRYNRKYCLEHKAEMDECRRKHDYEYPDKRRARAQRRRARKRKVTTEKFADTEIFERDCWICQICGKHVDETIKHPHPRSKSLDHIIPLSVGGEHSRKNVQLAHLECNITKRAKRSGQLRLIG